VENYDIKKVPMVRVTWFDAKDMETGWLHIKDIVSAPLAVCQEVRSWCIDKDDNHGGGAIAIPRGWVRKIEYLKVDYATQ
jgi:hypothetical protein